MAEVKDSKVFNLATLAILGISFIMLGALQWQRPSNTISKAPRAVLPLAQTKNVDKAGIDKIEGTNDVRYSGRLSVSDVNHQFAQLNYNLPNVLENQQPVPRLFLSALPFDLKTVQQTAERKALFFKSLLPLVLKINEDITAMRAKVWRLRHRLQLGQSIHAEDRIWLDAAFNRYGVSQNNFDGLLRRMDKVPPSLALAQAAEESGWGTSRFVREGNALFGQWTFNPNDKGIIPQGREEGKTHRIKAFDTLAESLKAYVHNLNTHKAYRELRAQRFSMRKARKSLDGYALATALDKYSERGEHYVSGLQSLIEKNNLQRFDKATLDQGGTGDLNSPLI